MTCEVCAYGSDCEHMTGAHLANVVDFTNRVGYHYHSYYNTLHVIAQGVNRTLVDRQMLCTLHMGWDMCTGSNLHIAHYVQIATQIVHWVCCVRILYMDQHPAIEGKGAVTLNSSCPSILVIRIL